MIGLILSDLDGTLLRSDGKISQRNLDAIRDAMCHGCIFAIATGRYRSGCQRVLEMLGLEEKDICCAYDNGAHVVCRGESIYDGSISRSDMRDIVHFLRDEECTPALYIGKNWIVERKDSFFDSISAFYDGNGIIADFDDVLSNVDGSFSGPMKIAIRAVNEKMPGVYSRMMSKFPEYEYYLSNPTILEMNYIGKGKNNGLAILANHLGVDMKDTLAIGDYDNDAAMIRNAGVGVAMANASMAAKAAADFITLSNDEDGFAFAVEKFCLGGGAKRC
ncbi:MAG TPA: hypothetical protein DCO86_05630 [Spirochaetaceae bacterium]|nr:hypothetical protein [Spirochaetaceae bacterium]